jgi:transcriptional regulator with XRE-family HTH domain
MLALPKPSLDDVTMKDRSRAARAAAARRGALGMTQQELADAARVDVKTIGNLEKRGTWPIARTRARIEDALGWPADELERVAGEPPDDELVPRDAYEREIAATPDITEQTKAQLFRVHRQRIKERPAESRSLSAPLDRAQGAVS